MRCVLPSVSQVICSLSLGNSPQSRKTYKCVVWAAGDNASTFLVWKPAFDSALLSALRWYHLAGIARKTAIWRERGGERNQGPLYCRINHANQWWGLRRPLTCSPTPQSAILLKACVQWSGSRRWRRAEASSGAKHLCWWRVSTKDEYSSASVLPSVLLPKAVRQTHLWRVSCFSRTELGRLR